ncbi:MAG: ATP-binding cassette domain-containing protein, partial [Bacteroidota bacterium]
MVIELADVSKRYRREWILRKINLRLEGGQNYAITGPNGSGKSTFLRLLSGHLTPSKGQRRYLDATGKDIPVEAIYEKLSFAAPYIELIEEFTLEEAITFHQRFRPLLAPLNPNLLIKEVLALSRARHLPISRFSSGMKQRVKLALACCTQS